MTNEVRRYMIYVLVFLSGMLALLVTLKVSATNGYARVRAARETTVGMYTPSNLTMLDIAKAADMTGGEVESCSANVTEAIYNSDFGVMVSAQCVDTTSVGLSREAISQLAVYGLEDSGWFYVTPWLPENNGLTTYTMLGNGYRQEALTVAVYDSVMVIYYVQPVRPVEHWPEILLKGMVPVPPA